MTPDQSAVGSRQSAGPDPQLTTHNSQLELAERLEAIARRNREGEAAPVWVDGLSLVDRQRMTTDFSVILEEPALTAEPLDWRELLEILREYAPLAGWEGPLFDDAPDDLGATPYRVEIRDHERRAIELASPAVQRVVREVVRDFLSINPSERDRLVRGQIKKMANLGVWQIDLPDGYRMQYQVDEPARTVNVTYLGPHR